MNLLFNSSEGSEMGGKQKKGFLYFNAGKSL